MLARKQTIQMGWLTRVFLDCSLLQKSGDGLGHMEELSPSVHGMKKKIALHSWGSGRVPSFNQPKSSE